MTLDIFNPWEMYFKMKPPPNIKKILLFILIYFMIVIIWLVSR